MPQGSDLWPTNRTPSNAIAELHRISSRVEDWRDDRGKRHDLSEGIVVLVLAFIAGAQDAEEIASFCKANLAWLRQFFPFGHGAPTHDFYLRLMAVLKPGVFELIIRQWIDGLRAPVQLAMTGAHVAFDGQRLRGSMDRAARSGGVHMLSA